MVKNIWKHIGIGFLCGIGYIFYIYIGIFWSFLALTLLWEILQLTNAVIKDSKTMIPPVQFKDYWFLVRKYLGKKWKDMIFDIAFGNTSFWAAITIWSIILGG